MILFIISLTMSIRKESSHVYHTNSPKMMLSSTKPSNRTHRYRASLNDLKDISEFVVVSQSPRLDPQRIKNALKELNQEQPNKQSEVAHHQSPKISAMLRSPKANIQSLTSGKMTHKKSSSALLRHHRKISTGQELKKQTRIDQHAVREYQGVRSLFNFDSIIGRGGFGKVWKVELKRNGKIYALKQMSKALIIAKKSIPSVMGQRRLLALLRNPFIVNMVQSFQDRENLYLAMDYLPGGDLRTHMSKKHRFSENEAKFIISCLSLGLDYLHSKNVIHRDIKPENIVFDDKGYARITDLGIAKIMRNDNSQDSSGTPGYMAPEVMCCQNHGFAADYFALGIIAHELMLKKRPYYGHSRRQLRDQMLSRQVQVKKTDIPENWSLEAADFINRLIQRKPLQRLGYQGSHQIWQHPWLRQYPVDKVRKQEMTAPYRIEMQSSDYVSFERSEHKELILQNELLLREPQIQKFFEGYETKI